MRQRKAVQSIESQKHQIVAALYSNPNLDDSDNNRPEVIKQVEAHFNEAMRLIYDPDYAKRKQAKIDWTNPFWAAAKRQHEKIWAARPELRPNAEREKKVVQLFDMDKEQVEARKRSRAGIDQLAS